MLRNENSRHSHRDRQGEEDEQNSPQGRAPPAGERSQLGVPVNGQEPRAQPDRHGAAARKSRQRAMDLPVSRPAHRDLGRHALADGHIEEDARCPLVLGDGVPQSVHHGLDGPADGEEGRFGGEDEEFAESAHVGPV